MFSTSVGRKCRSLLPAQWFPVRANKRIDLKRAHLSSTFGSRTDAQACLTTNLSNTPQDIHNQRPQYADHSRLDHHHAIDAHKNEMKPFGRGRKKYAANDENEYHRVQAPNGDTPDTRIKQDDESCDVLVTGLVSPPGNSRRFPTVAYTCLILSSYQSSKAFPTMPHVHQLFVVFGGTVRQFHKHSSVSFSSSGVPNLCSSAILRFASCVDAAAAMGWMHGKIYDGSAISIEIAPVVKKGIRAMVPSKDSHDDLERSDPKQRASVPFSSFRETNENVFASLTINSKPPQEKVAVEEKRRRDDSGCQQLTQDRKTEIHSEIESFSGASTRTSQDANALEDEIKQTFLSRPKQRPIQLLPVHPHSESIESISSQCKPGAVKTEARMRLPTDLPRSSSKAYTRHHLSASRYGSSSDMMQVLGPGFMKAMDLDG